MEQLLLGSRAPERSGAFLAPLLQESSCSDDALTETSSITLEEVEEAQTTRRITLCKQVLLEATSAYSGTLLLDMPLLKRAACRNSGALLPLLSLLAAEPEPGRVVRALDTLSFLLLDRANRRACHELRALDVLLDILRRASDQQVQLSCIEAVCCLCKHEAKEKMALWQHPNRGALLSMLNSRHSSTLVIETLRVCRTLCFAAESTTRSSDGRLAGACAASCCSSLGQLDGRCGEQQQPQQQPEDSHSSVQLLEPALLTVAAELLHPSTDVHVLRKALKLLHTASSSVGCATRSQGCCGCWHNAVFRIVPLLTHCPDVDVVESALAVLVNLSQHDLFHNMCFASGCIPPLLHLLNHKRCAVSQSASCVLSALAEGGLSRDKLCQDTALLAMLRVLHSNHCVVVTLGVLYMLGRLASYRSQVVRSLKGWGAVQLLTRLQAMTRDEDAAEGCRQLLQLLCIQPHVIHVAGHPAASSVALAAPISSKNSSKTVLHTAYSITAFSGALDAAEGMRVAAAAAGGLCRTISAAAAGAATCMDSPFPSSKEYPDTPPKSSHLEAMRSPSHVVRPQLQSIYCGGVGATFCGPLGPIAASVASSSLLSY